MRPKAGRSVPKRVHAVFLDQLSGTLDPLGWLGTESAPADLFDVQFLAQLRRTAEVLDHVQAVDQWIEEGQKQERRRHQQVMQPPIGMAVRPAKLGYFSSPLTCLSASALSLALGWPFRRGLRLR